MSHVLHDPPSEEEAEVLLRAFEGGALDATDGTAGDVIELARRCADVAAGIVGRPVSSSWILERLVVAAAWRLAIATAWERRVP